jgi:hypothetical protein
VSEPRKVTDPDYKFASIALWLSHGANVARLAGIDFEISERARMLCESLYQAISIRGARIGEIVDAINRVRMHGSILDDLPAAKTVRQKPPMGTRD